MAKPRIAKFNFTLVTPAFLEGVRKTGAELRLPSLIGQLRFWWRAKEWGRVPQTFTSPVDKGRELHAREGRLWGLASDGSTGGQGVFAASVAFSAVSPISIEKLNTNVAAYSTAVKGCLTYLLGQGLWHFRNGVTRNALDVGKFSMSLVFRPSASDDDVRSVCEAFWLLGTLGGIGARSRRGWGSLVLTHMEGCAGLAAPSNIDELKSTLNQILGDRSHATDWAPFSAFSTRSRVDASFEGEDALTALAEAGRIMLRARSYYPDGGGRGKPAAAGSVARQDHDAMYALVGQPNDAIAATGLSVPGRGINGLPHNYSLRDQYKSLIRRDAGDNARRGAINFPAKVDIAPRYLDGKARRRASPLIMHVHQFGSKFHVIHTLLPAVFLPAGMPIVITSTPGYVACTHESFGHAHSVELTDVMDDYSPIFTYLDSFTASKSLLEPMP